jgi:hypothetical protein
MFARAGRVALALGFLASAAFAMQAVPDPLVNLSREASAVFLSPDGPHVLLLEDEHGVQNSRTLAIGDEYRDGWVIRSIDAAAITLIKAGQTRQIRPMGARAPPLVALTPPAPAGQPAGSEATAKLGTSNAGLGAAAAQSNIEAAIARGDPDRVKALGGTNAEIALARFAALDRTRQELLKPGGKRPQAAPDRVKAINQSANSPPR